MAKHNPDELHHLTLTRGQILELLAHTNFGPQGTPTLKVARSVLRRSVREPKTVSAANQEIPHARVTG